MVRFAEMPHAAVVLFCVLGVPALGVAQDGDSPVIRQAAEAAGRQIVAPTASDAPAEVQAPERRPGALLPLYAAFVTLQALDVHSTTYALAHGGVEGNPVLKGLATSEVGLLALKAAGTTAVIMTSERMWKRNKAAAVIFMIAANSGMAWVVQHNYRAVR